MVEAGRALFGSRCSLSKLTEELVLEIRQQWNNGVVPATELAVIYNVSAGTILDVVNRKTWTHI